MRQQGADLILHHSLPFHSGQHKCKSCTKTDYTLHLVKHIEIHCHVQNLNTKTLHLNAMWASSLYTKYTLQPIKYEIFKTGFNNLNTLLKKYTSHTTAMKTMTLYFKITINVNSILWSRSHPFHFLMSYCSSNKYSLEHWWVTETSSSRWLLSWDGKCSICEASVEEIGDQWEILQWCRLGDAWILHLIPDEGWT